MAKTPRKIGRPRKEVDYTTLESLCAIQCTGIECCGVLGMEYETLNSILKRDGHGSFPLFFEQKKGKGRTALRRAQYKLAVDQLNPTMLIWLGKQHLDQSDKKELDLKSSDGTMTPKGFNDFYADEETEP